MQASSALRLGNVGPLNVRLHYTWLLAAVLGLWWLALLWLPDNYPTWPGVFYWLIAVAVLVLFFLSVVAHELAHTALARSGRRTVFLFPFGAAQPFRLQEIEPARAVFASLAGPVFNLVLGGLLLVASGLIDDSVGILGGVKALAHALGQLNLALAVINLLPGVPFDGGWLLASGITWFGMDSESALRVARSTGRLAALALVLLGAWQGLTTDRWIIALALVLVGWAAREAGSIGQQRSLLLGAFEQMKARELMERTRPADAVSASDSVADMVRSHPRYDPATPLPVLDDSGTLVGIASIGAAEELLQGTWATTPVSALMKQASGVAAVAPGTPLTRVLDRVEARRGTPLEEQHIPVIDDGVLVGSIDPNRLVPFTQVEDEFGINNVERDPAAPNSFFSRLGAVLPAAMVIAAMAILGNLALRTDPAELRDLTAGDTEANVTFSNMRPAEGAFMGLGETQISIDLESARPISDVTILLDGTPLETTLTGADPMTRTTATAQVPSLLLGPHSVSVTATTLSGRTKTASWGFRVTSAGEAEEGPDEAAVPETPGLEVLSYRPALGARVLAGSTDVQVSIDVHSQREPTNVSLIVDGQELEAQVSPVEGVDGRYQVSATLPRVVEGVHQVKAQVRGEGSNVLTQWTFSALTPNDDLAYFEPTGRFVAQPFLDYWRQNGGLAIFGYPISERVLETDKATGQTYTALYFERARFELHMDLGNQVVLGRLGALLHEPEPAAQPIEGAQFFPETGHNLSGKFLDYWNSNGGLALFGYPISEERMEVNPIDGKEYLVQYFERNRFELHPEEAGTPFEVQLGQLGTQLYREKYGAQ